MPYAKYNYVQRPKAIADVGEKMFSRNNVVSPVQAITNDVFPLYNTISCLKNMHMHHFNKYQTKTDPRQIMPTVSNAIIHKGNLFSSFRFSI